MEVVTKRSGTTKEQIEVEGSEVSPGVARRLRRRETVYLAAIELFTERGYEATSIEDIAERADVSRGSVFNYFQYKLAFLEEWGIRRRAEAVAVLRQSKVADPSVRTYLQGYMRAMAQVSTNSRAETVSLMGAASQARNLFDDPPMARDLSEFFHHALGTGKLSPEVDPDRAALLISTSYTATLVRWLRVEPPFDLAAELLAVLDLLLRGLETP